MRAAIVLMGVMFCYGQAGALEPVGDPEPIRGAWAQRFVTYSARPWDHIQLAMVQGAFDQPDGFDPVGFVPDTWSQAFDDGVLLLGDGPPTESLEFRLVFATPLSEPLTFYYQEWTADDLMVAELTATWDGSTWTLRGGSPWANARVDGDCLRTGTLSLVSESGEPVCCVPEGMAGNETVVVHVRMSDVEETQTIVGGQFFLSFDPARLRFESMTPGEDPFLEEVYESVDPLAGTIDYGVGLLFGGEGTSADRTMAVITFTALNEVCASKRLVTFREYEPPSLLVTDTGAVVCPLMMDRTQIEIDATPPTLVDCPGGVESPVEAVVECDEVDALYPVYDTGGALLAGAVDTCDYQGDPTDDVVVTFDEQRQDGDCPEEYTLTRTWWATDACGNHVEAVLILYVVDTVTPSLIGCPADGAVSCAELDTLYPVYDGEGHLLVTAVDACDPEPMVTLVEDIERPEPACFGTYTLTRTWTAVDACGNTAHCTRVYDVYDDTPPTWDDPDGLPGHVEVACDEIPPRVDPPASDDCAAELTLTFTEDESVHGLCETYTITRTWTWGDGCGNACTHVQYISVVDVEPPSFDSCPDDMTVACDEVPAAFTPAVQDNCDETPAVIFVEYQVPGDCPQDYVLRRTWTATDACGNSAECVQLIEVVDTEAPEMTCPDGIVVSADAGTCEATVHPEPPPATDACDPAPVVGGWRDDGLDVWNDPYPLGTTEVTWLARDACGNERTCVQEVSVLPFNTLAVTVEMEVAALAEGQDSLERCITFELWDCGAGSPVPVVYAAVLSFDDDDKPGSGRATAEALLADVPCGPYTCITARDTLHSLSAMLAAPDFRVEDGMYVADFAGAGKVLLGGNANDDTYIDIRDYGVLVAEWGRHYDSDDDGVDDGHTPCHLFDRHADFNGDGRVWQDDYMYIQHNFLATAEPPCCRDPRRVLDGPRAAITVAELLELGEGDLAIGDLNADGWLDGQDMLLLAQGEVPQRGDLNCDGLVNNLDLRPFVLALTDPDAYAEVYPDCNRQWADCNGDGIVDNFDISAFVHLVTGQP